MKRSKLSMYIVRPVPYKNVFIINAEIAVILMEIKVKKASISRRARIGQSHTNVSINNTKKFKIITQTEK